MENNAVIAIVIHTRKPMAHLQGESTHWWNRVFDLASSGAMFAKFSRKHVGALKALVLQYGRVTLRSLFFLKPLTKESVVPQFWSAKPNGIDFMNATLLLI